MLNYLLFIKQLFTQQSTADWAYYHYKHVEGNAHYTWCMDDNITYMGAGANRVFDISRRGFIPDVKSCATYLNHSNLYLINNKCVPQANWRRLIGDMANVPYGDLMWRLHYSFKGGNT